MSESPSGLGDYLWRLSEQARHPAGRDPIFALPADAPPEFHELVESLNSLVAALQDEQEGLVLAKAVLEQATDAAEAASRAKTAFLANLSHDLRTPLNAILGFAEMLATDQYGPVTEQQKSRLARILANGHSLLALLNDVLDLTRIEAGKIQLHPIDIDLGTLLRTVAAGIEPEVARRGLALEVDLAPDLGRARVDIDRLRQVLGNLLSNAMQYTEAGTLTLSATPHPDRPGWVRIAVTDTGPGIAEAALPHIWDEFYQVETGRGRKSGAGLGLPISRKLITLLGGDISVVTAEGAGSCFTVDLPREWAAEDRPPPARA